MKYKVTLNGVTYEVEVAHGEAILVDEYPAKETAPAAVPAPVPVPAAVPSPVAAPAPAPVSGEAVSSPMPGTIVGVKLEAGASVKKGQTVVVLEAMKMENDVSAPKDGTIARILVAKGQTVNAGEPLFTMN